MISLCTVVYMFIQPEKGYMLNFIYAFVPRVVLCIYLRMEG